MRLRFKLRVLGPLMMGLALVLLWSGYAAAAITIGTVTHDSTEHTSLVNAINANDCSFNTTFSFPFTDVTDGVEISIWGTTSGADCLKLEKRDESSCKSVTGGEVVSSTSATLSVQAQDIANVSTGTGSDCDGSAVSAAGGEYVVLYFLVDDSQETVTEYYKHDGTGTTAGIQVDLNGPAAPTNVCVEGADETKVTVSWSESASIDAASYYIYCDSGESSSTTSSSTTTTTSSTTSGSGGSSAGGSSAGGSSAGGSSAGGSSAGGSSAGGSSAGGSSAGGSSAGGSGGTTGSTGGGSNFYGSDSSGGSDTSDASSSSSSSSSSSTTCTTSCTSSSLVEGDSPPETVSETSTGTSADVTVTADTETTCAVAAVDSLGNVGLLSNLSCATPGPVTDFFEYYNSSGGTAGNGCSCGLVGYRRGGLGGLAALLLVGIALGARRRRAGGAA